MNQSLKDAERDRDYYQGALSEAKTEIEYLKGDLKLEHGSVLEINYFHKYPVQLIDKKSELEKQTEMFEIANRKIMSTNCYSYLFLVVPVIGDVESYRENAERYRAEADDWRSKLQLLNSKSIMCYI